MHGQSAESEGAACQEFPIPCATPSWAADPRCLTKKSLFRHGGTSSANERLLSRPLIRALPDRSEAQGLYWGRTARTIIAPTEKDLPAGTFFCVLQRPKAHCAVYQNLACPIAGTGLAACGRIPRFQAARSSGVAVGAPAESLTFARSRPKTAPSASHKRRKAAQDAMTSPASTAFALFFASASPRGCPRPGCPSSPGTS